jgi:esterase/lipase superfamily enzyme
MSKITVLTCTAAISSIILIFNALMSLSIQAQPQLFPNPIITTPLVSTRGHFNLETGELLSSSHSHNSYGISNVAGFNQTSCPTNGIALYVHGVCAGQSEAREQLDRIKLSLNANGFNSPVVGYTWDSNTAPNPSGWVVSKFIANQNGPKLAKFISDYKDSCSDVPIRVIAHSLGARIVESTLMNLNNSQTWIESGRKIDSIHLMGAAISDKATSRNTPFGAAINNVVTEFITYSIPKTTT